MLDIRKTVFFVFTIYLVKSRCLHFPEVSTTEYYVPVVNLGGVNESVVYIMKENNANDMLLGSLITGLHSDQSVTLSSGAAYNVTRKARLNRHTNLIILTENLTMNELNIAPLKRILKSHWSPVYIITTARNGEQTCENGTINNVFLENAQDYMNTIWHNHRVIRVIISFPYTCPHHFIIYSGKKRSNKILYDRTIKIITATNKQDLKSAILTNSKLHELTNGFPLRANMFYRFPTAITECDVIGYFLNFNVKYSNGFCGLDGLLMHDYIKHFQYNLTIPRDESCNVYGFVDSETHRVSGTLGCIVREQIDMSFNSRFLTQYATKNFFYLHYITADSLAVVMRRPEVIPLWHYAFNTYGPRSAAVVSILVTVVGVLMWVMAYLTKTDQKPRQLHEYILTAMTCTLFGYAIERKSDQCRLLKGACLFCSIVLLAVHQGSVNYQFTTRTRYSDIRTLKQLYHSKYMLFTSPSLKTLLRSFVNKEDPIQAAYLQKTEIKNESVGIEFILEHPDTATLERGDDVQIEILLNYTDNQGSPILYVIDETFHVYYMSYIARPGFLFVEESLQFMMRMLEAGLPPKYYSWTRRTLKLGASYPKTGAEPRPFTKIELDDLRIAFSLLGFGCFISTCSFVIEIYRAKLMNDVTPS